MTQTKHKVVFLFLMSVLAMAPQAFAQILPDSAMERLFREDETYRKVATLTEQRFNELIDEVVKPYTAIVRANGGRLVVKRDWASTGARAENAFATQTLGTWSLNMFGALARRPEVTEDGFQMVVCHELGHHLAGFPFVQSWAADEGQADYFATMVCAKKIWATQTAINARARSVIDPYAKQMCDNAYRATADRNLCYRSALAGKSLATLLEALSAGTSRTPVEPKFDTPDKNVVTATNHRHPKAQCRLDTYFQGALCPSTWVDTAIPGRRHPDGQASLAAERAASDVSCTRTSGHENGLRPTCWFKPNL